MTFKGQNTGVCQYHTNISLAEQCLCNYQLCQACLAKKTVTVVTGQVPRTNHTHKNAFYQVCQKGNPSLKLEIKFFIPVTYSVLIRKPVLHV